MKAESIRCRNLVASAAAVVNAGSQLIQLKEESGSTNKRPAQTGTTSGPSFDLGPLAKDDKMDVSLNGTKLGTGHIILLELQRVGPGGYNIPVEWWPDDLAAIMYATSLGLLVVEAAGNGHPSTLQGVSLDAAMFDTADVGFPSGWRNPLDRRHVDSGAIIVGAGVPPVGTSRVDRSRMAYSNWGRCVDVQGWGDEVVTTGYGCKQGGVDEDRWYIQDFGGTSAASAMVAGTLACVQGYRRRTRGLLLDSRRARALLRATGSRQKADGSQFPLSQHIGPRPNLRKMLKKKIKRPRFHRRGRARR